MSAVIIEDKVELKKNSLLATEAVQIQASIEEFCNKLHAGKNAQVTKGFMITSRIGSLIAGKFIEDALQKANTCVEPGQMA